MKKMLWHSGLSVGIKTIDGQHQQWIICFNDTVEAIASEQESLRILKTPGFLVDYAQMHFSTEETYMLQCDYPGSKERKAQQDTLRSTLMNLV